MQIQPICTSELSVNDEAESSHVAGIRCKRWSCPYCKPINTQCVIREAVAGKPKRFLTLTLNTNHHPDHAAAALELKRGLRLLRLRLRRHKRLADFEFMAVFEAHQSGYPHLHLLLVGKFIPWHWLKRQWTEITGSTHVDIRKIKGRRDAARYVAKYLGKDLHAFPGCKRWWRSHGYPREIETDEQRAARAKPWQRWHGDVVKLADHLEENGWTIERQRNFRFRAERPPDEQHGISWHLGVMAGTIRPHQEWVHF